MSLTFLSDPAPSPQAGLVLAHGAGAAMDTEFMQHMAAGLAARGVSVLRFEFPYMARRRREGGRRPPDPMPVLEQCWREAIAQAAEAFGPSLPLWIGGKSMGGRVAARVAAMGAAGVRGVVCLGYPFHPPGRPERLRLETLQALTLPTLVVQGERDTLGNRDEVAGYDLPPAVQLSWLVDGDHSFKPRRRSGVTLQENLEAAVAAVADYVLRHG